MTMLLRLFRPKRLVLPALLQIFMSGCPRCMTVGPCACKLVPARAPAHFAKRDKRKAHEARAARRRNR
jgi:hypothetical protein